MTNIITFVLAFVVAISVLVAVHEFGHYWVARRLGIRVLRFSIGFGLLGKISRPSNFSVFSRT